MGSCMKVQKSWVATNPAKSCNIGNCVQILGNFWALCPVRFRRRRLSSWQHVRRRPIGSPKRFPIGKGSGGEVWLDVSANGSDGEVPVQGGKMSPRTRSRTGVGQLHCPLWGTNPSLIFLSIGRQIRVQIALVKINPSVVLFTHRN